MVSAFLTEEQGFLSFTEQEFAEFVELRHRIGKAAPKYFSSTRDDISLPFISLSMEKIAKVTGMVILYLNTPMNLSMLWNLNSQDLIGARAMQNILQGPQIYMP